MVSDFKDRLRRNNDHLYRYCFNRKFMHELYYFVCNWIYYENEISKAENRLTKEGFLGEFPNKNYQLYNNRSEIPTKTFVGIVLGPFNDYIKVEQRNHFRPEDTLEVFGPGKKPRTFKVESIYDTEMNLLDAARHPRQEVLIKIPFKVEPYDLIRKAND